MRIGPWIAVAAAPLVVLAVLLARPAVDVSWENQPAHFWLVLGAAALATALGTSVNAEARRRRDARLILISLALVASTGFLGLHALATPGVLLDGPNAGFELATPVGLVVAGVFAAAAALELRPRGAETVNRGAAWMLGGLAVAMAVWAIVSVAALPPLDGPLAAEQLDGWQLVLAALGVALYGAAALGFLRLYRRRAEHFVFAFTLSFAFLAEAMVAIAWARNWRLSWWEWHVLMLGAFVVIAVAARREWHEERYSPLYLEETRAGTRDVSILFADLAGFTSFSERHESNEVAAMLNEYFEAIVPLMERGGGEVHQLVGDEIMVIFGLARPSEDHALEAARAALVLQEVAERVSHDRDDWPRFRVGVGTGEVHAGVVGASRGHRKRGIVGDVVNVASRLQSEAPVGGVLVGDETRRRLGDRAVVEELEPRRVKGKATPVAAFRLLGVVDPGHP